MQIYIFERRRTDVFFLHESVTQLFGLMAVSIGVKLVLLPALSLESRSSKTGDGRTRVLCCLLKSNLDFYSFVLQKTDQEAKTVHIHRGAHMEVFRKTHTHSHTQRQASAHWHSVTHKEKNTNTPKFPLYFSWYTPRHTALKHFFPLLMILDLMMSRHASLLTSWQLPHWTLPWSFKRFKM